MARISLRIVKNILLLTLAVHVCIELSSAERCDGDNMVRKTGSNVPCGSLKNNNEYSFNVERVTLDESNDSESEEDLLSNLKLRLCDLLDCRNRKDDNVKLVGSFVERKSEKPQCVKYAG